MTFVGIIKRWLWEHRDFMVSTNGRFALCSVLTPLATSPPFVKRPIQILNFNYVLECVDLSGLL